MAVAEGAVMDSEKLVKEMLLREWTMIHDRITREEEKLRPLREKLAELSQALEDYGFQDRS